MIPVITFLALAALTHAFAGLLIKGEDRRWVSKVMLIAWFSLFPLLALINLWFPFTGADDEDYFYLAATPFDSLADFFDLTRYEVEQPGYPWLLSILYQLTGHDLLAFKLLNLALFVMLIPFWYRIGAELESKSFGRAAAVAIFLLTPLWYYAMFLFKDIAITLLQSVFLLGLVQVSRGRGKGSWLLSLAATLALIPFRSQLVLVNVAVLVGAVALMSARRGQWGKTVTSLIMSAIVVGAVLTIASDRESMAAMGIYADHRVVGLESTAESATLLGETSRINRTLFPLLYLFSETAGLNPQNWTNFDASSLRGVLALSWIFTAVPFFMVGLLWLIRRNSQATGRGGVIARVRSSRVVATPWGSVLLFILCYMAVSWTVGDTTRWRIPDMPAMAAVALGGWFSVAPANRMLVLLSWVTFSGGLFAMFYLMREQ
ncbi:MAG: hypothetical protein ACREBC_20175 [Pyrinomonadaceae bacterium]